MTVDADVREFLEGAALAVPPPAIEATLAALWRPAAEEAQSGDLPAFTRVSLGTEVVVTSAVRAAVVGSLWNQVSAEHPSRAILVLVDPAAGSLQAAVSAACHLAAPGQPQVCSERIQLRCGPAALPQLPGTILPLLEPDVPATLWWDLPTAPPPGFGAKLGRVLDRCLTDLTYAAEPAAVYQALRSEECEPLGDLAWFRAAKWREGTARLFDGLADAATLQQIERLEVVSAAGGPGELLPAALLAAWAAGRLGWQPAATEELGPQVPDADQTVVSRTRWQRPGGAGRVTLATVPVADGRPGRLQRLTLEAPVADASWQLERLHDRPRELRVEAHHAAWCRLPSRMPASRPEPLEVLLHALSSPPVNQTRDAALRQAAWILGWDGAPG
ncbi:MAG: glucose-6-phosphate dehydrogenase assembly protein OpcA [Fimbriimonadaceae bacterium]|nr:glucose-6-phosphate dehydrogenase assembly protein OpcA [Fimbriimonadaceae bacterium]